MALTLSKSGRIALADLMRGRELMLAVGNGGLAAAGGAPAWGAAPPPMTGGETALVAPLALLRCRLKQSVVADPGGDIEMSDGSCWRLSNARTEFLYAQFLMGLADGPGELLTEIALYIDPVLAPSVPPGQRYIPWAQVADPGQYYAGRRFAPKERSGVQQVFGELMEF